jgi:hypothetical protein
VKVVGRDEARGTSDINDWEKCTIMNMDILAKQSESKQ